MDLHLHLKQERERQGKPASEVAAYIGVSEDMLRRYDSGRSEISLRKAATYAECLGKQLGDVIPSSRVRATDLQPFLVALEEFEPHERMVIIEKAARDAVSTASLINARVARNDGRPEAI